MGYVKILVNDSFATFVLKTVVKTTVFLARTR